MYEAYSPRQVNHGPGALGLIAAAIITVTVVFVIWSVWSARVGLDHANNQKQQHCELVQQQIDGSSFGPQYNSCMNE